MADLTLTAQPRLGGVSRMVGGTRLREVSDVALVSVACPLGGEAALDAAMQSAFGVGRPGPMQANTSDGVVALPLTADQCLLVLSDPGVTPDKAVSQALNGAGYTTDQTDTWVVLDLSGPLARPVLERLCPLDTHPDSFAEGAVARTVMEHMGAIVWRTGPDSYRLMSASSSAESFLHAVETSLTYVS